MVEILTRPIHNSFGETDIILLESDLMFFFFILGTFLHLIYENNISVIVALNERYMKIQFSIFIFYQIVMRVM